MSDIPADVATEPFELIVEVTSICQNESGQRVKKQELFLSEFSAEDKMHVLKNFHVTDAIQTAMHELAQAAGYNTNLPKGKK